jgi:hypothetical protein
MIQWPYGTILVDAKNQATADCYKNFGFLSFASRLARLFLPTVNHAQGYLGRCITGGACRLAAML